LPADTDEPRKLTFRRFPLPPALPFLSVIQPLADWPLPKLQEYLKDDTLALIGYGSQGHGQGLNARDNGINVIVGVREGGESWKQAQEDGWVRFLFLSSRSHEY
jgi:hypothetical protein